MMEIKPTDFTHSIVNTNNVVIISAGQAISTAIASNGLPLLSIQTPSNFTASDITFLVSLDNGNNYVPLKDSDSLIPTLTGVGASNGVYITTTWLAGFPFFKLQTSIVQVNEVNIILGLRRVS